jgi:beta-lactamase class A
MSMTHVWRFPMVAALVCAPALLAAQEGLESALRDAASGFRGTVGIYVHHLRTGETVSINADTLFPTASMIKVPILCGVFDKIEREELDYHAEMTYRDSLLYAGVDILGSFADSSKITLSKLAMLMIATSDNTASLWLQLLAGTGTTINSWLERNGYMHTRVNSRTPGREAMRSRFGWGVTTPREMATLLVQIREGRAVSPGASEEMYRVLSNIYWSGEALSEIPPTINASSKQGAVDRSRSEVVLVNAPHGDYVFCVITKDQDDTSWIYDNEGYVLLRTVSRILWNHFEPDFGWKPVPGHEKWAK